ncbi:MAG: hypothetical protein AAFO83_00945 [Cyanobacteria bacterium J06607_13]
MPILSTSDKSTYFPEVDLQGSALLAALTTAQVVVEGYQGANRPLEVRKVTQAPQVDGDGIAMLSDMPVLVSTDSQPIKVQIRGHGVIDPYRLSAQQSQWIDLTGDLDYQIDLERGELRLTSRYAAAFVDRNATGGSRRSPSSPITPAQLRIEYYSGFDFTDDTDPDVRAIKAATAQVLLWLSSPAYAGIERVQVDRRVAVTMQGGSNAMTPGTVPESMLMLFKRYAPRSLP